MKKIFSLGLLFGVILYGCTSNTSSNGFFLPSIEASIEGVSVKTISGTNVATFDTINKTLTISGHLDSTGKESLVISLSRTIEGITKYDHSNSGIFYFIGKGIDTFYTSVGAGNEIVNLEEYDTIKKIVSGTFTSDVFLAGQRKAIKNGSFINIPLVLY